MINGFGFCSYNGYTGTPVSLPVVSVVSVENGIFNVLDMSLLDVNTPRSTIPEGWDWYTIMRAEFNGDVSAGNVDYSFYSTTAVRIKRREVGKSAWITLFDIPIKTKEDFNFTLYDKLNRSKTNYEYAVIPITGSIEGGIVSKTVYSEFDGICIYDGDDMYFAVMDTSLDPTRVQKDSLVSTMGRKFPTYVKTMAINYSNGSGQGFFLPRSSGECGFTTNNAVMYRETLIDFMTNHKAKILKDGRGYIWIAQIQGDVPTETQGHPDHVLTRFNWVQLGDATLESELREFGFLE